MTHLTKNAAVLVDPKHKSKKDWPFLQNEKLSIKVCKQCPVITNVEQINIVSLLKFVPLTVFIIFDHL